MPNTIADVIKAKRTADASRSYTEKMQRDKGQERAGKAARTGKIDAVALATLSASAPRTPAPTAEEIQKAGSVLLALVQKARRIANGECT